jgi:hypothetical protein
MRLYNRLLRAVGWYEPSMDDVISHVGVVLFDQGVLCLLAAIIVILAVHILHKMESKHSVHDDLVITLVHLLLVCIPFMVCEKPSENIFTPQNLKWKLLYYGVGIGTFMYNIKRFCKKPKQTLTKFMTLQSLLPTKKEMDSTLGDRLKELMPLIVFEMIAMAFYVFFFSLFGTFLTYSVAISIFICIFFVSFDLHKHTKKVQNKD